MPHAPVRHIRDSGRANWEPIISKKRLLVVLDAGSSIPLSVPSVADIDRMMRSWGEEWSHQRRLPNYFQGAWDAAERYYGTSGKGVHPSASFETVLGEFLGLANWLTPAPCGNALRDLVGLSALSALAFPPGLYAGTIA